MASLQAAHRLRLVLSLAIVYVVWGSSYLAAKIGVSSLPPLLFGGARCSACWSRTA